MPWVIVLTTRPKSKTIKMKRRRVFRLGRRLVKLFRWRPHPRRTARNGSLLGRPNPTRNPFARICSLLRCLGFGQKGYVRLGQVSGKTVEIPKGHLAVYIGEMGGEARRVVVPVIYFNHPLFGELLAESERIYGFNHSGGITIPCRISEFEKIKMRIANRDRCKRRQCGRSWLRF